MRIGKKGLNPTIPVCHYCGKTKNMIMLTGIEGEKWAKKNGRSDGEMPMTVYVEDDIEPCDECKAKGIAIVEVVMDEQEQKRMKYTGARWLVTEACIERLVGKDSDLYKRAMETRVMFIEPDVAEQIGLKESEK